jgi:hypothetical protein
MNNNSEVNLQPRLDPFVFPSGTTLRFILLIVLAISVSLNIYNRIYWKYRSTQIDLNSFVKSQESLCTSQVDPNSSIEAGKTVVRCMKTVFTEFSGASWFAVAISVGILVSIAALIYSLFPVWTVWKEGLVSLEKQPYREDIVVYLRDLCQEIGIRPPRFLEKRSRVIGGRAFGALGRYYVVLSTGLIAQFDGEERKTFRAVMLHELSHLRNQDVDKIYFSVAISCAFVIVTLVPYVLFLVGRPISDLFQTAWRVIALTLMVYLSFVSVVRSREFHADVRASTYPGSEALALRFQIDPKSEFSGWRSTMISILERLPYFKRNRWQFAFLLHPPASERRQILATTDRLFSFDIWAAFTTGIVITLTHDNFFILTSLFASQTVKTTHASYLIASLIYVALIVGTIGIGVWRRTFVSLMRVQPSPEVGKLGIWLGLGMILGRGLSLKNAVGSSEHNFIFSLFGDAVLLVSLYYFFKWMATCASAWLRVAVSKQSPYPFYSIGIIVSGFCLTLWFWFFLSSKMVLVQMPNNLAGLLSGLIGWLPSLSSLFLLFPPFLVALVSLWAFPLSTCLWYEHQPDPTSLPKWGFLDRIPDQIDQTHQEQIEINPALRAGIIGGAIYLFLLLAIRLGIPAFLPEAIRSSEEFKFRLLDIGNLGLAVLIQAVIAIKVARTVRSFNKIHGLFAAFIGGCVMSVSSLALNLLFGDLIDARSIWYIFSQIINWGALLSLLGMLILRLPKGRFF